MAQKISHHTAQQIVNTVKDICDHDINFIDENGMIIASTNTDRIGDFHEIGRQVILTQQTMEVTEEEEDKGVKSGINMPIRYNGQVVAVIGITGNPQSARKYGYLAQRITALLLREQELDVQSRSRNEKRSYIIRALAAGEYIQQDYFSSFLDDYQISEQNEYTAILVRLSDRYNLNNLSLIEQTIVQTFERMDSPLYTFNYPHEYILLIESQQLPSRLYLLQKLAAANQTLLSVGIGASRPLSRISRSYRLAEIAISSLPPGTNIISYNQLGVEMLLADVSPSIREQYQKKVLGALTEKDILLLKTYFNCNMSLKETSEQLYLHKNTLQYHLDRIARISHYNPRHFRDAVTLYCAVTIPLLV